MNIARTTPALLREGLRFALVGVLNVVISFIVFYLCYVELKIGSWSLGIMGEYGSQLASELERNGIASIDALVATGVGYLAGVLNSFVLNSKWTFAVSTTSRRQFVRFCLLNLLGLAISSLAMFYFVDVNAYSYLATWFLTTAFVMIMNFLGSKYWAFADIE